MTDDGSDTGGGLRRWSRRKQQARVADSRLENPAEAAAGPAEEPPAESALEELPDDAILARLGLPDPDTLVKGADFAAFMARGVPHRIRNRALRRLWVSDPVLANLDGLIDYAEDYSDAAKAAPGLHTAYRVGKGYADRLAGIARPGGAEGDGDLAVARAQEAAGGQEVPSSTPPSPPLPSPSAPPVAEPEVAGGGGAGPARRAGEGDDPQQGAPAAGDPAVSERPDMRPARRRRMVFRVAE